MSAAEEFHRLLRESQGASDPEEKISALRAGLELEPSVPDAALSAPREQTRGMLLFALGLIYHTEGVLGERADNLEEAIAGYEAALALMTPQPEPRMWAEAEKRLAEAYRERAQGDPADNIERTIDGYSRALTVLTQDAFPDEWAEIQHALGDAFLDRIKDNRADNLDLAGADRVYK